MPKGYPPSVFVSSTCYDLNQIRADLKTLLDAGGFESILSETPAFPVNPQVGTVENCAAAVKDRADIFVLIIGGRYGSLTESGNSVTNLEYLAAKAKGVPIYVFVMKRILHVLPVWKANPQGDYKDCVDTPKLFEFVEQLRDSKDHWVFEFEKASVLIDTLRHQLAYLFMESLALREKIKASKFPPALAQLSGECLKLVIEKPSGWEFRLLIAVLREEMKLDQELQWDLNYRLKTGRLSALEDLFEMSQWILQKFREISGLVQPAEALLNVAVQEALGAPGVAGDVERIVYVGERVARIRKALIEWTIECRSADVKPECERVVVLVSDFSKDIIEQLEAFPGRLDAELEKAIVAKGRNEKYTMELMIKLAIPPSEEFGAELKKLTSARNVAF